MRRSIAFLASIVVAILLTACSTMTGSSSTMPSKAADGTLVGPSGMTLYTYKKDGKNTGASECYEQCATNWPPLVAKENEMPTKEYTQIIRMDGSRQWTFNGFPLYYYAKDAKAGDKTGDGRGGNWNVAK
ncbi:MAG: ATP-binding protein [Hylemonella sp.]